MFLLGPSSHSKILQLHPSDSSEALRSNFNHMKLKRKVIDLQCKVAFFLNSGAIPYNMVYLLLVLPKEKCSATL